MTDLRARLRGRPVPELSPRMVPGYERAMAAGLIQPVPPSPPNLLPGATAHREFLRFLVRSAVAIGVMLAAIKVIDGSDLPSTARGLLAPLVGLAGLWLIVFRFWGDVGRRSVQEIESGYTTFVMSFGAFGWGERRRWQGYNRRAPWNYSGLWVLNRDGSVVVSAPDRTVDPPGFYPSPNRGNEFELWTGEVWSGRYRPHSQHRRA